jgi:sugar phosphate isomerase/epimerase
MTRSFPGAFTVKPAAMCLTKRAFHFASLNVIDYGGNLMRMRKSMTISRRNFFSLAGGALAAAAIPRQMRAAQGFPVGIQLYMVNSDLTEDPAGTLKKIAQIGYTEVETAGWGTLSAAQFRDLVRDAGLRAPSAHLGFGMQDTGKLLDDAKTLGVEYVVSSILLPSGPQGMQNFFKIVDSMTADDFRGIAAKANEIGQKVKAVGLKYAYHNHNFEFRDLGGGKTGYEILLQETDPSLVKFEADCGWMTVAGEGPIDYLTRHGDRFAMLHIKDFKNITKPVTTISSLLSQSPDMPTSTELGLGSIDLRPIVEAGLKAGVTHMFVEQEPPFKEVSAMEAAEIDYRALKSFLG